jgi:hypothetical protein
LTLQKEYNIILFLMKNTKQTKSQTHYWVVKNNKTGQYLNQDVRYDYTKNPKNAMRLLNRKDARRIKSESESIYKMIQNGNDINLIPEWK